MSTFDFRADLDFAGKDPVLKMVLPLFVLQSWVNGPSFRELSVTRAEIIDLLHVIANDEKSPVSDRETAKKILGNRI